MKAQVGLLTFEHDEYGAHGPHPLRLDGRRSRPLRPLFALSEHEAGGLWRADDGDEWTPASPIG
jgi:hypothetical protein